MNYGLYAAALLAVIGLCYWLFKRKPHALFVLAYEKAGTAYASSPLKNEWVSPKKFEERLVWLKAHGFTPVSLSALQAGKRLAQKPVLLAFLGGYQSFYSDIFPLLKKHNIPAALFLPPALIGTYNAWQNPHTEPWQNLLTEKQLKDLHKSGLIGFGALAPQAEDLTSLPAAQAAHLLEEAVFRMQTQLKLKPEGIVLWPAKNFDIQQTAQRLPAGLALPVFTPLPGVTKRTGKKLFYRSLFPQKKPFLTRYLLWKHR